MRSGNILFSAVHFFVVLFILCTDVLFLAIPDVPSVRFHLTETISAHPEIFKLIGWVTLGFGVLLFIALYLLNRRRFLTIKMEPTPALVDEAILQDYVQGFWSEKYPKDEALIDINLRKGGALEIIASASSFSSEDTEEQLLKFQTDLGEGLSKQFGYYREFYLTLSD